MYFTFFMPVAKQYMYALTCSLVVGGDRNEGGAAQ